MNELALTLFVSVTGPIKTILRCTGSVGEPDH